MQRVGPLTLSLPLSPYRVDAAQEQAAVGRVRREEQLAQELDERLAGRLSLIRSRLEGKDPASPPAAGPPGTGLRLDIRA